ncbi:MAG TPA: phosphate ABC transporter, permease protein PstA, partial [Thomasclavelia ramosa]|nr:phosphate ABC transporter, permease protein PstA [Thomasclavelia ramosa]
VLPKNIFTHLSSSGATLTIQLYLEMAKANYESAFVIALVLIVIVLGLNMLAKLITNKFDVNRVD